MSFHLSIPLQEAVFQHLRADSDLAALVGSEIHDALPPGAKPQTYVRLGPEKVRDRSDMTGFAAEHELVLSVITTAEGFHDAKEVAAKLCDALQDADLALAEGRLTYLRFASSRAHGPDHRGERRIDLSFTARVEAT